MKLSERLRGYRRRVRHEVVMWRFRRLQRECSRRYEVWINRLRAAPPEVFVGPDLASGGVRGHVRAIKRYSSLRVQLVPDEAAMGGLDRFTAELRECFMSFEPVGRPCVHSHVVPWYIQWCRRQQDRGLRWIHTYHAPYFPEYGRNGLEPDHIQINDALIHEACHADVRLSVSRWQQDYLLREHGIETEYLPNGIDVEACDRGRAERFRKRFRVRKPFILWVGRNDPVKNPVEFVRLAAAMPEQPFVMIGGGLSRDSLLEDWNVEPTANLMIFGGASHAGVQDALAACSVLVATSKREGLPTLVLEGMAHQKPVVVSAEPGSMEVVNQGEFGQIYPLGQIDDLVEQTQVAISIKVPSTSARQRVINEYDWRVVAPKLDALYRLDGSWQ